MIATGTSHANAHRRSRARTNGGARPRRGSRRTILTTITQIPAYLRLLGGMLTDPRVDPLDKLLVGAAIAYVVLPIDVIPDVIPVIGQVDDVFILVLAIRRLISRAGMRVVRDHWDGPIEDLHPSALQEVLLAAAFFLPRRMRRRLRKLSR